MAITAKTQLKTKYGIFQLSYHEFNENKCLSFVCGDIVHTLPLVRMHSACLFGETFQSLHCDCQLQLQNSMKQIAEYGHGIITYAFDEGRGIGLKQKIKAMEIQQQFQCDTIEAFEKLGLPKADFRTYQTEITALKELHTNQHIQLISGNPNKKEALEQAGFIVDALVQLHDVELSKEAHAERIVKVEKLGYLY